MIKTIDFKHSYYKFQDKYFSTIRGKTWSNKIELDEIIAVTLNKEFLFNVRVLGASIKVINEIPLDFLKLDAEYKGFTLNSVQEFVDLINSFRPPHYYQATPESKVTVIFLEKLNGD